MRAHLLLLIWAYLCSRGISQAAFQRTMGETLKGQDNGGAPSDEGRALRRSKRGWMWNQFFLLEEYIGTDYQYVGKLHSDQDRGDGTVKYVLYGDGAGSLFLIDENSGDIHATKRLDREEKAFYTLRAQAVSKRTGRPLEPESEFIIKIHDINDNEPKFSKETYLASVPEMSDIGTSVIQVTATDADDPTYGNSARLVYSILQGQPYFSIEPETGVIRTALSNMNRETREHFQVVIQAKDMAGQMGGLSGTATVSITLSDVNDSPPRFPQGMYQFSVLESAGVGASVGRISATDADVGRNAEMEYSIIGGDGLDFFEVVTDRHTQEGVVTLRKLVDFEKKRMYVLRVQVENPHLDPRFLSKGPFKDTAMVKVSVEDVDEPPDFQHPSYMMEVKEDAPVGSVVGSVSAMDPDATRSPVRYSIDRHTDMERVFNIHPGNGSIFMLKSLDREEHAWHNISIIAAEFDNPRQTSRVPVYIRVLDVNDNAPTFATYYETFVCENAKDGQTIQTISATDADDPVGGQRFYFSLAPEASSKANFTVRDNQDNTAGILTRGSGFSRIHQSSYQVPVVIMDSGGPAQSSTSTLTVHVCSCDRDGNMKACSSEALLRSAGLSTDAIVAILLCVFILLMIVVLFAALRRQKKKEPLIISKEDVRDNVVSYNDEGGGEEDTQAFDIGTLRNPEAVDDGKQRRDIVPESVCPALRRVGDPCRENTDVRDFINQRLQDSDTDPVAPPYDSLATYAYEGTGSVAESLSSLGSVATDADHNYDYLSEWGPRFRKLADLYGAGDASERDS
ncbi:cadherin-6-like isoform X1 [Brienomyrus brachyistius]|uniref:cadherin-6-like isoform X1 n=1 Tax=Brienomyrus brachyistius TaxID=42636 RepID=UPI0020B363C0|nr:cadherin-6-like isoform X1 [Brienomyrus brachyistius]XP_048868428.1 cadherin-6-like isoform X1 [Brienomyrus brachyistius]